MGTLDDIMNLERSTEYKEEEIKKWFNIFRAECPSCQMSRAHVVSLYSWVMPEQNAEMFVDQIFRAFDRDNNGSLDFHEFLKLTEFTEKGSIKDKLSWAFKVYDKDMSGTITATEMLEVIGTVITMEGLNETEAAARVEYIFNLLDTNRDGEISLEEFLQGCLED